LSFVPSTTPPAPHIIEAGEAENWNFVGYAKEFFQSHKIGTLKKKNVDPVALLAFSVRDGLNLISLFRQKSIPTSLHPLAGEPCKVAVEVFSSSSKV
jgi:hypothetical protein